MIITGKFVPGPLVSMQYCPATPARARAPGLFPTQANRKRGATDTAIWMLPDAVALGFASDFAAAGWERVGARQAAASMT